jgi:membrane associated rhomboid family serine protease
MKIHYNSPFVLTFTLAAVGIMLLSNFSGGQTAQYLFTVYPHMSFKDPLSYFRTVSHILGHANWNHLVSNFTFILLLGPMLEEKYGTKNLLIMTLITAVITGIFNNFLFSTGLFGASGIVFMFILLSSFANIKSGHIPLTFLLIAVLFLGKEIFYSISEDQISQFAHIVGGVCGAVFGFIYYK